MAARRRIARILAFVAMACAVIPTGVACASSESRALIHVPDDVATLTEAAHLVDEDGMIVIGPGVYAEQLSIDTPGVTVRGESRNDTIIDGGGIRPYGVVVTADGVRVENLTVHSATFYGVLFTGLHDESGPSAPTADGYRRWDPTVFPPLERFLVDHVTAYNNGLYGIYAFNARHGVIRDSYASGSADSGFYVGQCVECDILVTGNVAERNAVGFENANASDSLMVAGNRFSDNRVGVAILSSYQEAFTPQRGTTVVGNLISNNASDDSPAHAEGGFGIGIGLAGGQDNTFSENRVAGHPRAGIVLSNTEDIPTADNSFVDTVFDDNAIDVADVSASRTPAVGNCVESGDPLTSAPASLARELHAACADATTTQSAVASLDDPAAPVGVSFLRVAPPRPQPNLRARDSYPPLPARITLPDAAQFPAPSSGFLADRIGTR
ncbi:nitrous oxide reductase family maturation protein NosD [Microbacterium koreense]|uniref:Nitrous oxide reductase family maturation protein NosD n=1 Tax=Microbacterium koreense TaxID=323761 RepID=A0ABW2ZM69_9MICO